MGWETVADSSIILRRLKLTIISFTMSMMPLSGKSINKQDLKRWEGRKLMGAIHWGSETLGFN